MEVKNCLNCVEYSIVQAVGCVFCNTVVFSRSHYDYRQCKCGKIAIDGGRSCVRYIGDPSSYLKLEIKVPYSHKEMENDFQFERNQLGYISLDEVSLV